LFLLQFTVFFIEMPWANVYPPITPERAAEIRARIERDIDFDLVNWECELREQNAFVNQGKNWVGEVTADIKTEQSGASRALENGLSP
jgi:hypothetical protein